MMTCVYRDLGEYAPSIEVLPVGCCGSGGGTIKKEAKLLTKITVVKVTGLEVESAGKCEHAYMHARMHTRCTHAHCSSPFPGFLPSGVVGMAGNLPSPCRPGHRHARCQYYDLDDFVLAHPLLSPRISVPYKL